MTRHLFGETVADYAVVDAGDGTVTFAPGTSPVTFWNARTGGTQYTDLSTTADGSSPVTGTITSTGADGYALGQVLPVYGPDDVWYMWASANDGPRVLLITRDVADTAAAAAIAAQAASDAIAEVSSRMHPLVFSGANDDSGNLITRVGTYRLYNDSGAARTIGLVRASVGTAPAGGPIIIDVNINGTSIFTSPNRPSIAAAAHTGSSDTFATATWDDGDYLTVDVDQVGSGTPGADLTVAIWVA